MTPYSRRLRPAACLLLVVVWAANAPFAGAAVPVSRPTQPLATTPVAALGPNGIVFDSNRGGNYELFAMNADGSGLQQLTNHPLFDSWWPKLSPDRTQLLFYRSPAGVHDRDHSQVSLWSVNLASLAITFLLPPGAHGWQQQGHVEWSPDGTRLVMFGGALTNPQMFVTDTRGLFPRQVTNRAGYSIDPSWTPDGRSLLFVGCPMAGCAASQLELYRMPADGGAETRLTNDGFRDHDPYSSPDGRTISWLRETKPKRAWGILRMAPDGSGVGTVIDDGGINSKPAWSVDSTKIFFHRRPPGAASFSLFSVRPDGGSLTPVPGRTPRLANDEYPVSS